MHVSSICFATSRVADALLMAVWRRGKPNELLRHSDQGSQYTSDQFQRLMADSGIVCCMSRSGNVWDSAAMESFFSSLKTERTAGKPIGQGTRPKLMCSTTSSGSTMRPGVIRRSVLLSSSARWD
jgi:putative transposase